VNKNEDNQNNQHQKIKKRNFSLNEKRNYCLEFERSKMNQIDFCKMQGISKSALYNWIKLFKKNKGKNQANNNQGDLVFSPLVLEKIPSEKQTDITQLTLIFQNQMQLSINMPEHRLVSFLLELGYATTIVR